MKLDFWKCAVFGAGTICALFSFSLAAQEYPVRPVSIFVGSAAGSGADLLVRFFADKLRPLLGQPVVVENRPGAFGNIAASAVAKARPDGHTLLIAPNITFAVSRYMFKDLPYDPVKDFSPLGTLSLAPFVLLVDGQKPGPATVAELTSLLRTKGNKASFGAPTGVSLACAELYRSLVNVDAVQIPYKAMQQALIGLSNGDIDFLFADSTSSLDLVRSGRYRALAVTTEKRSSKAPAIPTMIEAGVAGFLPIPVWFAAAAPAGTPTAIADRLNLMFRQILATEEAEKFMRNIGADAFAGTRQDMVQFQAKEIETWGRLAKISNLAQQ